MPLLHKAFGYAVFFAFVAVDNIPNELLLYFLFVCFVMAEPFSIEYN